MKMAIKLNEYQIRYAWHNVVSADVNVVLIYPKPLMQVHKVKLRYLFGHIYMIFVIHKRYWHFDAL